MEGYRSPSASYFVPSVGGRGQYFVKVTYSGVLASEVFGFHFDDEIGMGV